jgi:hypothetical protein
MDHLPAQFPGLKPKLSTPEKGPAQVLGDQHKFLVTRSLEKELTRLKIRKEMLKEEGLDFIRRKNAQGSVYFISNLGDAFFADSLELSADYGSLVITDPLNGKQGELVGSGPFYLEMAPGKSFLIQTLEKPAGLESWQQGRATEILTLDLEWTVSFEDWEKFGLKESYRPRKLTSWTTWKDKDLRFYTGKASYESSFSLDHPLTGIRKYLLEIGEVRESAQILINGHDCGTLWSFPNRLEIPADVLKKENRIEIVVQNLSANYMKKYDPAHPEWKKFYDINFVDITYDPFSTRKWPFEPSGIIGDLRLITYK